MSNYQEPDTEVWNGRTSDKQAYFHEIVECVSIDKMKPKEGKGYAFLGFACDEGVKRNLGRSGAWKSPGEIRKWLAKTSNHLDTFSYVYDVGDVLCPDGDLESTHSTLEECVHQLLNNHVMPVLLGGGHDIAYGHFNGIRKYVGDDSIGIINLDAHFDLRKPADKRNSGTPFYQIAEDSKTANLDFHYLCLGVQPLSNTSELFETADKLGVKYLLRSEFDIMHAEKVIRTIEEFISKVDHVYLTIDMDGFSTAISPGVSAPSPFGYQLDIVMEALNCIVSSDKLISLDVAEVNPEFDRDSQSARLAAALINHILLLHNGSKLIR